MIDQRQPSGGVSVVAVDADAVKLHAMVDEPIAEFLGDLLLQRFQFRIDKLKNLSALDVDQVIVMRFGRRLIARASIAEVMPVENARFFEKADGAVNGSN